MPLPLLQKISTFSPSTYKVDINVEFITGRVDLQEDFEDNEYARFQVELNLNFNDDKVDNWFCAVIQEKDAPCLLKLKGQNVQDRERVEIVEFNGAWITNQYQVPILNLEGSSNRDSFVDMFSTRRGWKIVFHYVVKKTEDEGNYSRIKDIIRINMPQQTAIVMKHLFPSSKSPLNEENNEALNAYKMVNDRPFSRTFFPMWVEMEEIDYTFLIQNNTSKKLVNDDDDSTYVVSYKLKL